MVTGVVPHVGGPILKGEPTVITGKSPQARITDLCTCVGPPDVIVKGGDYDMSKLPETALVNSWGGQALALPFVAVAKIRGKCR